MKSYNIILLLLLISFLPMHATIHIIGDSHAKFCFEPLDQSNDGLNVIIHWIGPITMHRIGRDGFNFLDVKKLGIQDHDTVVFSFGEIDARCHIGKIRDQTGHSLEQIITSLVEKYVLTILENKKRYNLRCIIFNVIPPSDYNYDPEFPYYGTLENRISITKLLNEKLKNCAHKNELLFLNIYDYYASPSGYLKKELSDGNIHINRACNRYIREQLIKLLLWST